LDTNSSLYVERGSLEAIAAQELEKIGCLLRVQAPKRMGKSSFLNRLLKHAQTLNYRVVKIDFLTADDDVFLNLERFLRWFSANVSRRLGQPLNLDQFWDEDLGAKVSCTYYFEDHILESLEQPFVLALNEVNRVFEYPHIAKDFLPLLRFWNEQAKQEELFQKLRMVLVHSTEVYVPLKVHQSPFNIGSLVKLPNFDLSQTQSLASRFGLGPGTCSPELVEKLLSWVGGSPYRLSLVFYFMRVDQLALSDILKNLTASAGIFAQQLREMWSFLNQAPELRDALVQVLLQPDTVALETSIACKLNSLGLIDLNGMQARVSCPLYEHYFSQQLSLLQNASSVSKPKHCAPETLIDRDQDQTKVDRDQIRRATSAAFSADCLNVLGGRYKILSELGSGGFGTTYLAQDIHRPSQPYCVVKKLICNFEPQELQEARRLFDMEAQALEQLGNHEQIPRLFAYFEQDGDFFLVEEWIDGQLLSDELAERFMLSDQHIANFLIESLTILDILYQNQLIHRDIKPKNIIRRASDLRLVLIDFGSVKSLASLCRPRTKTVAIGTQGYTPWEQAQGLPQPNSDIYGLGVIAIEMATGLMPGRLECDGDMELRWRPFAKRIDARLVSIIERMVKHSYRERYQMPQDVIEDLKLISVHV
ncbi:MAG: AAA-like domain-containing protein, partial [Cyanobacteria bacterium P01_F01_bin.42]